MHHRDREQQDAAVTLEAAARCLHACGCEMRLRILILLVDGPMVVSRLAACCGRDLSSISRELKRLRDGGLVECTRDKNRRVQSLSSRVRVERTRETRTVRIGVGPGVTVSVSLSDALVASITSLSGANPEGTTACEVRVVVDAPKTHRP